MLHNLNVCLHNIVDTDKQIQSIYDITTQQLLNLNTLLKMLRGIRYESYTLYFDDGYKSFNDIVSTIDFGLSKENIRCAIIVDQLDAPDKLTTEQVKGLGAAGHGIDSHGMSHASLASFRDGALLTTPKGGVYQNQPYGQNKVLAEEEILFQVRESQAVLGDILGRTITNFVLPYGLYNTQALEIIISKTRYTRILTCHTALDQGQILAPRLLITQENINQIKDILDKLSKNFTLLTEPSKYSQT